MNALPSYFLAPCSFILPILLARSLARSRSTWKRRGNLVCDISPIRGWKSPRGRVVVAIGCLETVSFGSGDLILISAEF